MELIRQITELVSSSDWMYLPKKQIGVDLKDKLHHRLQSVSNGAGVVVRRN